MKTRTTAVISTKNDAQVNCYFCFFLVVGKTNNSEKKIISIYLAT